VPTVDALVGSHKPPDHGNANGHVNGTAAALNGHERPRNPIVDALEAMLGRPERCCRSPRCPACPRCTPTATARAAAENLADAVTERVLERLLPEITATVQRLVQEEVDRIRQH
jgi:hypothetical protein